MDSKQIDVMVADASHEVTWIRFWIPSEKLPRCAERASQNAHTNMWRLK